MCSSLASTQCLPLCHGSRNSGPAQNTEWQLQLLLQLTDACTICYHSVDPPDISRDAIFQGRKGVNY